MNPIRVKVSDGSGKKELGEGNLVGFVSVYFIVMPDGSLCSLKNAEEKPEELPEGGELVEMSGNPKIVLDNGDVVYGCQVWWEGISEKEHERALVEMNTVENNTNS